MALPKFFNNQFSFKSYPNTFFEGDNTNHIVFTHNTKNDQEFLRLWDNFDVGKNNMNDTGFNRNFGKWSIKDGKLVITLNDGKTWNYPKSELSKIEKFWVDNYETEPEPKPKEQEKQKEQPKGQSETPKEEPKPADTTRTKPEFDFEAWKEQNKPVQPQKPQVNCTEWNNNNLFEINFKPEFKEQVAKDFVAWYIGLQPAVKTKYDGVCGFTEDGTFTTDNIHKNGLVRRMAESRRTTQGGDTYFNIWSNIYRKTNSDKFKDETQMKESIVKKLKSIKETKSLKESLVNKLNKKKIEKKVNEVKVERGLLKLSESYTFKRDDKFYSELGRIVKNYKTTPNFLTENTDQTFSDAFKFVFSNGEEQIKKETINRLFKSLSIEEGTEIANQISEKLTAMETTEIYLNCLKVSSIILSTMITAITSELSSEATGSLEGMVKSVINSSLNSSENMEKLKYQINNVVCPVLEGYKTRIVDMPKQISNAFTNMI